MTLSSWHSYPSIYNLGHRALYNLFEQPVRIQEKIDGSQFSFGVIDGELRCRSKGATLDIDHPEALFKRAVESVRAVEHLLCPQWTYRGEYLSKPKHNTLMYNRVPAGNIILFDINIGEEDYLDHKMVCLEATHLGLEAVPTFYEGMWQGDMDDFKKFLELESCLGGPKIEGVVIKSETLYGPDHKRLMGKHVSEAFKEVHQGEWKKTNPGRKDIIDALIEAYCTEARWKKAVQHLREAGQLQDSPRDIGLVLKETTSDVYKECIDDIKDALLKWAWPQISRGINRGEAEWYKDQLAAKQFEGV